MKWSFIITGTEVPVKTREQELQNDNDDDGHYGGVDMKNIARCGVTAILLDEMLKYSCSICCVATIAPFFISPHSHCGLPAVTL